MTGNEHFNFDWQFFIYSTLVLGSGWLFLEKKLPMKIISKQYIDEKHLFYLKIRVLKMATSVNKKCYLLCK